MSTKTIRDIILEELTASPKNWSQLLHAVRGKKMISQSTFYFHLVTLLRNGKISKTSTSDGLKVYEIRRATSGGIKPAKTPIEYAEEKEIAFLLDVIGKAHSDVSISQAFTDLRRITNKQSVRRESEIWKFFADILSNDSYEGHWSELIGILRTIAWRALSIKDEHTLTQLHKFLPRVSEIAKNSASSRAEAVNLIDQLMPDEQKFKELKEIAMKTIEAGDNLSVLGPLAKMYKTRKTDLWEWLYPLLDDPDEKKRKSAKELLEFLRAMADSF
jgi:hypothetical protein